MWSVQPRLQLAPLLLFARSSSACDHSCGCSTTGSVFRLFVQTELNIRTVSSSSWSLAAGHHTAAAAGWQINWERSNNGHWSLRSLSLTWCLVYNVCIYLLVCVICCFCGLCDWLCLALTSSASGSTHLHWNGKQTEDIPLRDSDYTTDSFFIKLDRTEVRRQLVGWDVRCGSVECVLQLNYQHDSSSS